MPHTTLTGRLRPYQMLRMITMLKVTTTMIKVITRFHVIAMLHMITRLTMLAMSKVFTMIMVITLTTMLKVTEMRGVLTMQRRRRGWRVRVVTLSPSQHPSRLLVLVVWASFKTQSPMVCTRTYGWKSPSTTRACTSLFSWYVKCCIGRAVVLVLLHQPVVRRTFPAIP